MTAALTGAILCMLITAIVARLQKGDRRLFLRAQQR